MNTLTKFIDMNLGLTTVSRPKTLEIVDSNLEATCYEVIENETLSDRKLEGVSISGSLFSLTTFKNVTFESCVFFGSRLENCTFIGCTFKNCNFQFTHISRCNFRSNTFEENNWDFSPIRGSEFFYSQLDNKTFYFASKEDCLLQGCVKQQDMEWEQALKLPPIPTEDEICEPDLKGQLIQQFKKLAA